MIHNVSEQQIAGYIAIKEANHETMSEGNANKQPVIAQQEYLYIKYKQ